MPSSTKEMCVKACTIHILYSCSGYIAGRRVLGTQYTRSKDSYSELRDNGQSKQNCLHVTDCNIVQAFYLPNIHRPNLTVLTGARANRVLTEAQNDDIKATGVEFVYNHTVYSTHAKLEVIISCGYVYVQRSVHVRRMVLM